MYQKVTLLGRLGADAEYAGGNRPVKFSMSTWRNVKDENEESGWAQFTTWHKVDAWGTDSFKEYLATKLVKGSWVLVEGEIEHSSYVNDSGETKYMTTITARTVKPLYGSANSRSEENEVKEKVSKKAPSKKEDDLPF